MRSLSARRSARLPAVAFFAALACILAAPSESRAGCDNHVVLAGAGGAVDPFGLRLPGGDDDPADGAPLPFGKPRPCSGPSCSSRPDIPLVPPASEIRFAPQWACLGHFAPPTRPAGSFGKPPAGDARPIRVRAAIFHPPRPDSARAIA